jgi:DNA-binding transcriptional LysR family regulator
MWPYARDRDVDQPTRANEWFACGWPGVCREHASGVATRSPVHSEDVVSSPTPAKRVDAIDWAAVTLDLNGQGWSLVPDLLAAPECDVIAAV